MLLSLCAKQPTVIPVSPISDVIDGHIIFLEKFVRDTKTR